ncbi:MAG: hypothetical protein ACOYXY_14500 [Thermodesulfobacteriota bacterium]
MCLVRVAMGCYCADRRSNAQVAELMKDIPEGYCGICDVCGKPGHTRAHPSLPTTGAWCDEHWAQLASGTTITLDRIVMVVIIVTFVLTVGLAIYRWVF